MEISETNVMRIIYLVASCFLIIVLTGMWYSYQYDIEPIRQGYSQQVLPGQPGVYWVKDGKVKE